MIDKTMSAKTNSCFTMDPFELHHNTTYAITKPPPNCITLCRQSGSVAICSCLHSQTRPCDRKGFKCMSSSQAIVPIFESSYSLSSVQHCNRSIMVDVNNGRFLDQRLQYSIKWTERFVVYPPRAEELLGDGVDSIIKLHSSFTSGDCSLFCVQR